MGLNIDRVAVRQGQWTPSTLCCSSRDSSVCYCFHAVPSWSTVTVLNQGRTASRRCHVIMGAEGASPPSAGREGKRASEREGGWGCGTNLLPPLRIVAAEQFCAHTAQGAPGIWSSSPSPPLLPPPPPPPSAAAGAAAVLPDHM